MHLFDLIAEQRIAEAITRGELENLPGAGRPLDLDDDALIPEDLRMAYRILRNAGFVPPEVEVLRDIGELERLIEALDPGAARDATYRRLQMLRTRIEAVGVHRNELLQGPYTQRVLDRFTRDPSTRPAPGT